MIDLAFDPVRRDLIFPPRPIDGAARVAQAITIRLRTWLGDWFLDTSHGVPYMESILRKTPNPAIVESILRAQILSVSGVKSIVSFAIEITPQTRTANIQFEADSLEGLASGRFNINV